MDSLDKQLKEFSVTVYGELQKYNDVCSRARCRVFYKYENRNGSYITDDFAEKLIATIPYTPVKGIYEYDDYTDHGSSRSLGRIYGIVPENPNFAWEKHLDEDGVEREYACVDVLLFTALYAEAGDIAGKAQSMEIYEKSIKGDWQYINSRRVFVYTDGCFLGLQVLGEEVEPCFEGAAFFSLYDSLNSMIQKIEEYNLNLQNNPKGGINTMPNAMFKISDDQKYSMLWTLLNPNCDEEHGWVIDYAICDVYDEYAVCANYNEHCFERVYYTKNDETDSLTIDKKEVCFIVDVTESEKAVLDKLNSANQGTYEKLDEVFDTLKSENTEFSTKIEELNTSIATLTTERDNAVSQYTEANDLLTEAKASLETAQSEFATLQAEKDELVAFKEGIELKEKQAVLDSYAEALSQDVINAYAERLAEFTAENLDKELAFEVKKANPSIFIKKTAPEQILLPKDNPDNASGLEAVLNKYKK